MKEKNRGKRRSAFCYPGFVIGIMCIQAAYGLYPICSVGDGEFLISADEETLKSAHINLSEAMVVSDFMDG